MRHISILALILFISISANAAVIIGYNGIIGPLETPELAPFQTASISVATDGFLNTQSYYVLGVPVGDPGTLYGQPLPGDPHVLIYPWEMEGMPFPGFSSYVTFSYDGLSPLPGLTLLVDNITFRCDGLGNVNLQLLETQDFADWVTLDSQAIRQIPEPGTIALLGLGMMLLKRRR